MEKRNVKYVKIGTEALLDTQKIKSTDISGGVSINELFYFIRYESLTKNLIEPTLELINTGNEVIYRASGSIALGKLLMGITAPTSSLSKDLKSNLAQIGQYQLMNMYQRLFGTELFVGQLLPTEADRNRGAFLTSIESNFKHKTLTIINENDALDYSEIDPILYKYGGNNDLPMGRDVVLINKHHTVDIAICIGTERGFYTDHGTHNAKLVRDIYYDPSLDSLEPVETEGYKIPLIFKGMNKTIEDYITNNMGVNSNGGKKPRLLAVSHANRHGIKCVEGHHSTNLTDIISENAKVTTYHPHCPKHL